MCLHYHSRFIIARPKYVAEVTLYNVLVCDGNRLRHLIGMRLDLRIR